MPSKPEEQMIKFLHRAGIEFEREKTFSDLRGGLFRYDFYCHNVGGAPLIIEVDGAFHREPIHGKKELLRQKENDRKKNSYCLAHKIKLIRVPDYELPKFTTFDEILERDDFIVRSKWHSDR